MARRFSGSKLRELRQARGWSTVLMAGEIERALGTRSVSPQALNMLETGVTADPKSSTLFDLLAGLAVPVEALTEAE